MRRTNLTLDEEIAEVERRLTERRAKLRQIAAEARSRVSMRNAVPVALLGALAIGFTASRFARRGARSPPIRTGSRAARLAGALASLLLPRLVRPLQSAATQWLQERMTRSRTQRTATR